MDVRDERGRLLGWLNMPGPYIPGSVPKELRRAGLLPLMSPFYVTDVIGMPVMMNEPELWTAVICTDIRRVLKLPFFEPLPDDMEPPKLKGRFLKPKGDR